MLQEFVEKGTLSAIDLVFADQISTLAGEKDFPVRACAAFLMAGARAGHICVQFEEDLPADLSPALKAAVRVGQERIASLVDAGQLPWICRLEDLFYLQKNWKLETLLLQELKRLFLAPPSIALTCPARDPALKSAQQEAIAKAFGSSVTLITGGPGTGKTFTAAHLVRAFLGALPEAEKGRFRMAFAAPTGRAAAHLERQIASDALPGHCRFGTLHSLLGLRPNAPLEEPLYLVADLIIVDECSMIDLPLFAQLLRAIPSGARLVLMGDQQQLPSVESGSVFADLVQMSPLDAVVLSQSMRSEERQILQFAQAVRAADVVLSMQCLATTQGALERLDLGLYSGDFPTFFTRLFALVSSHFPAPSAELSEALLLQLSCFRILSPMRQGRFGVDFLNQEIAKAFFSLAKPRDIWPIPILIVSNDPQAGLCNGDMGILVRHIDARSTVHACGVQDYALFPGKEKMAASALPPFEYGYCLSVHKSQGSEYDEVVVLAPEGSEVFGREVLYTAVTRAKKRVKLEISDEVLQRTLATSSRRRSGISKRIGDALLL